MEEDISRQLLVSSNDQSYHILKADTFTFCLICLEDINSTCDDVGKHLNSRNHSESIKCLFKGCNPSLIDDIEDERFVGMVLKSVFDISVLLGKATCYVSQVEDYWFCLICERNVTESNLVEAVIKENIVDHVLSDSHVKKVKGVCFLYRLNAKQDFLLLNKSIVYCSVCSCLMQCREVDLLKTAVAHLEMEHSNYDVSNNPQFEPSSLIKQEEHKMTERALCDRGNFDDFVNNKNVLEIESGGEFSEENYDESCVNGFVELVKYITKYNQQIPNQKICQNPFDGLKFRKNNICICVICKHKISWSKKDVLFVIYKHFNKFHKDLYVEWSMDYLINQVVFHKKFKKFNPENIDKKVNALISRSCGKMYKNYIMKTKKMYFCIICMVSMPSSLDNPAFMENLSEHFNSVKHKNCEKNRKIIKQALKTHPSYTALTKKLEMRKKDFETQKQKRKAKKMRKKQMKNEQKQLKPDIKAFIESLSDLFNNVEHTQFDEKKNVKGLTQTFQIDPTNKEYKNRTKPVKRLVQKKREKVK